MKFKKWNIAFLGLVFAVLIAVACANYFVDPFGILHSSQETMMILISRLTPVICKEN